MLTMRPCFCAGRENRGQLTSAKCVHSGILPCGSSPASASPRPKARRLRRLRLSILLPPAKHIRQTLRVFLFVFVRAGRIELPTAAWKAAVLPLNHARHLR